MRWTCRQVRRFMSETAAGVTLRPIALWVRRHVNRCPDCAEIWRQHQQLTVWLHEAAHERAQPPQNLWQRIALQLTPRPQPVARLVPIWRWAFAVSVSAMILLLIIFSRLLFTPAGIPRMAERPSEPDTFMTAMLHQHLAVTAQAPLNNPAFTAGIVLTAGEGR